MMNWIRNLSIKRKLLMILLFFAASSLLFASLLLSVLEISDFERGMRKDLTVFAKVIGNRSSAALLFDDKTLGKENLEVLLSHPVIQLACLYDVQGNVFARAQKKDTLSRRCPGHIATQQTHLEGSGLMVVEDIVLDAAMIGHVYIYADLSTGYWHKVQFMALIVVALAIVSLLTFALAAPLLKFIVLPISSLMQTVKHISSSQNFALRALKVNHDEIGVLVDEVNSLVTTVQTQNTALVQAKNRYLALYDDNPTMVFNLDAQGIILSVNRTGARCLLCTAEDLLAQNFLDFVHPHDLSLVTQLLADSLHSQTVHKQEFRQVCPQGTLSWLRATAKQMVSEDNTVSCLLVCEDITETRQLSEAIAYQANYDALTGLGNRHLFDTYIKQAMASLQGENHQHVLCYLDLDQFKLVNDTCGHLAGDELLRQLGELLRKNVRRNDFIARLGGDEFGILMYDCSLYEALIICEKLRDKVRDYQFIWEHKRFTIGVSIGVTAINALSSSAVELLKEADTACYAAKDKGRNRVHVYRQDDELLMARNGEMQWVTKIQHGLQQHNFCLYGQSITPTSGEQNGWHFEVLLRYRDEQGTMVPPGAFLPAAERYGLAPSIDRWVVQQLFSWLARHGDFLEHLAVCSINLSGLSLSDETLLGFIIEQFNLWQIPTHKICFEVTETAAIANLSAATRFIQQLREQGCRFSLDDFGSGLSSFAYLKNLPVDYLKIDGLFVKDILEDEVDLAMVRAINEVGHVMHKKTVAEFVENQATLELLTTLGIDYVQGYGIGKPMPLEAFLTQHRKVMAA